MRRKWAIAMGLVVCLLVLVPGCGGGNGGETAGGDTGEMAKTRQQSSREPSFEDRKLQSIQLTLEGYPDAENVGVLMADQLGFFADAGLEVTILSPIVSDNVAEYVAQEVDDVGLLPQPELAIARDKGMPLVAVGSLVSRPTMAMIWPRKSGIDGVADLEGKTIAINGLPSEEAFLQVLLARAGLTRDDVKVKSVAYDLVPALVKGRADAILGSGNVEGIELEARGLEPIVTPLRQLGVHSYEELVVVTRRNRLARDSRWIHAFMSAVTRGTAAAIADPEAAAEAIAAVRTAIGYGELGRPKPTEAKVEATLPLLSKTGRMSPGRAAGLVDWMREQGLIQGELPTAAFLTNRFVMSRGR